jgi:uncharacterized protein
MIRIRRHTTLALFLALALPATANAQMDSRPPGVDDWAIRNSPSFMRFHPDVAERRVAIKALEDGFPGEAMARFKRAASYADKGSQAVIAEMYFEGIGVERDRAKGYAWMDLAAERAYPVFLAKREHYWSQLSPAERERAIEVGQGIYEEFEDAVAKPRLERHLTRGRRQATGSRVGMVGTMDIIGMAGTGMSPHRVDFRAGMRPPTISGEAYYAPKYWEPQMYWEWQDAQWTGPRSGDVTVLPLRSVSDNDD